MIPLLSFWEVLLNYTKEIFRDKPKGCSICSKKQLKVCEQGYMATMVKEQRIELGKHLQRLVCLIVQQFFCVQIEPDSSCGFSLRPAG